LILHQPPVVVKLLEPKKETLSDVLIGALGLTGVMILGAVVAAIALGALLIWIRSRSG
jgi:hypothetical protein